MKQREIEIRQAADRNGRYPAFSVDASGVYHSGLSKREEFARSAMQAIIESYPDSEKVNGVYIPFPHYAEMAECAVQMADALLRKLKEKES